MITESFKFGIRNILKKDFLILSALLSLPLTLLYLFQFHFSIISEPLIFMIVNIAAFFYFPIPPIIFIFLVSEQLKKNSKKVKFDFSKTLNVCKANYLRILGIILFTGLLSVLLFIPSIAIAFLLPFSETKLFVWSLIFLANLIFIVYVTLRLSLAPYVAIIENKGIIVSLKSAWKISKGNVLKIFLLSFIFQILVMLLFIPIFMIRYFYSFAATLIVIYLLYIINLIYYPSAYTYFYLKALKKKK